MHLYLSELLPLFFTQKDSYTMEESRGLERPWLVLSLASTPSTWCLLCHLLPTLGRQGQPWLSSTRMESAEASRTLQKADLPWSIVLKSSQALWSIGRQSGRRWQKCHWLELQATQRLWSSNIHPVFQEHEVHAAAVFQKEKIAKNGKELEDNSSTWTAERACPSGEGSQGHQWLWQLNPTFSSPLEKPGRRGYKSQEGTLHGLTWEAWELWGI